MPPGERGRESLNPAPSHVRAPSAIDVPTRDSLKEQGCAKSRPAPKLRPAFQYEFRTEAPRHFETAKHSGHLLARELLKLAAPNSPPCEIRPNPRNCDPRNTRKACKEMRELNLRSLRPTRAEPPLPRPAGVPRPHRRFRARVSNPAAPAPDAARTLRRSRRNARRRRGPSATGCGTGG